MRRRVDGGVVFRGLVQVTLQRMVGGAGVLAASGLFASTYLGVRPVALILTVALAGLLFGVAVAWTGSLRGAVLGHVLFVVAAGAVWPSLLGRSHPPRLPELATTIALSVALAVVAVIALLRPVVPAPAPSAEPSLRAPLHEDEVVVAVTRIAPQAPDLTRHRITACARIGAASRCRAPRSEAADKGRH